MAFIENLQNLYCQEHCLDEIQEAICCNTNEKNGNLLFYRNWKSGRNFSPKKKKKEFFVQIISKRIRLAFFYTHSLPTYHRDQQQWKSEIEETNETRQRWTNLCIVVVNYNVLPTFSNWVISSVHFEESIHTYRPWAHTCDTIPQ